MRFSKLVVGSLMLLWVGLAPTAANADTIQFNGVGASSAITIGGTNSSNYHGDVMAGEMNWSWVGTPPSGFAQSFYSYCVDLASFVQGQQVVTTASTTSLTNGVAAGAARAAWLFNEYAAGIHAISNAATRAINAAALQVAIWEALYDNSNNLTGGAFTATTSNTQITSTASQYLTALYNAGPLTTVGTVLLTNNGQDQIVTRVSEPSPLLMMGLAFFAFAALARRPARQA